MKLENNKPRLTESGRYSKCRQVNSKILHNYHNSNQFTVDILAAIRHALGNEHTFEFIDGAIPAAMAPGKEITFTWECTCTMKLERWLTKSVPTGLEGLAGPHEEFLQYVDHMSTKSCLRALYDLEKLVDEDGPFDGVMSFSLGATLASSFIIYKLRQNKRKELISPTFRCAIFFSGGIPEEMSENGLERRVMSWQEDGEVIQIPTAHIWGANDHMYPDFGKVLSKLCQEEQKAVFIHPGGHEIPGPKDEHTLQEAIRVIKRTIERADEQQ